MIVGEDFEGTQAGRVNLRGGECHIPGHAEGSIAPDVAVVRGEIQLADALERKGADVDESRVQRKLSRAEGGSEQKFPVRIDRLLLEREENAIVRVLRRSECLPYGNVGGVDRDGVRPADHPAHGKAERTRNPEIDGAFEFNVAAQSER